MCNFGSNYRFVPTTHLHHYLVRYLDTFLNAFLNAFLDTFLVRFLVRYLVLNLDMRQGFFSILMPPTGGIAEDINSFTDEVRVFGR